MHKRCLMKKFILFFILFNFNELLYAQLPTGTTPRQSTTASETGVPASGVLAQPAVPNTDTIAPPSSDLNMQNKEVKPRFKTQKQMQEEGSQMNPNINGSDSKMPKTIP